MERRHSFTSSAIGVFAVLALALALAASLGAAPAIAQADDSLTAGAIAQQVTGKATAAKAQVNVKSLEKNREFTFTDMPYNGKYSPIHKWKGKWLKIGTVQNFALTPDNKYCFTTSQALVGSTAHTLLCCTTIPKKTGKNAKAPCKAVTVLDKYGHGEALDVTQPDPDKPVYYIWVACTAKNDPRSGHMMGTEIARLTYNAEKNKVVKVVKIANFKQANVSGGRAANFAGNVTPNRMNVTTDTTNNLIAFRVVFLEGGCDYVFYDYKKLNAQLDKMGNNKKYNIANAARMQVAHVRSSLIPTDNFQGFSVVGNSLFIQGGHRGLGAAIYRIPFKVQKPGSVTMQTMQSSNFIKTTVVLPNKLKVKDMKKGTVRTYGKNQLEVEGLKVVSAGGGKYTYRNIWAPEGGPIADTITVYKFTK